MIITAADKDPTPLAVTQTLTIKVGDNPEKGVWSPTALPSVRFLSSLHADSSGIYAGAHITENPTGPVQGMIFRSMDNGGSWTSFNNGLPSVTVAQLLMMARRGTRQPTVCRISNPSIFSEAPVMLSML